MCVFDWLEPDFIILTLCYQFYGLYHQQLWKMPPYDEYDDGLLRAAPVFESHSVPDIIIIRPPVFRASGLFDYLSAGVFNRSLYGSHDHLLLLSPQTAVKQPRAINNAKTLNRSLGSSIFSRLFATGVELLQELMIWLLLPLRWTWTPANITTVGDSIYTASLEGGVNT